MLHRQPRKHDTHQHHNQSFDAAYARPKGSKLEDNLLPLVIDKAHPFFDYDHLRKCFFKGLKNIGYTDPIEYVDRRILQLVFDEFNIFITFYQISEGYFFATFENEVLSRTAVSSDKGGPSFKSEKNTIMSQHLNKDRSKASSINNHTTHAESQTASKTKIANQFDLEKFLRWFQKSLPKMRNFNKLEMKKFRQKKELEAKALKEKYETPESKPKKEESLPLISEQKKILSKIRRDHKYKELLGALDYEKRFRRDIVKPQINEMDLSIHTKYLKAEHLVPSILTMQSVNAQDKYNWVVDIEKLQNLNSQLVDKLDPILDDLKGQAVTSNQHARDPLKDAILDCYKKKLQEDELQAKEYAKISQMRVKHNQMFGELRTRAEFEAIMREQPSAHEATRIMLLMDEQQDLEKIAKMQKKANPKREKRVLDILERRVKF